MVIDEFMISHSWLLFSLGVYVTARILLSIVISIIYFWNTHMKVRLMERENMKKKYGQWGVVTGCTSGIGEQFVHEMASLGMDVVLISRSLDKLNKLAAEIEKSYGVKTKVIACNYLDRNAHKIAAKGTEKLDVGILVNNVGLNTDTGSRTFAEMTFEDIRNMTIVNAGAATSMTKEFLPGMISRGRGSVLNIGSTSGYYSLPYQALYCACKSYMRISTLAMDNEIKDTGVSVRCNLPQWVRTPMTEGNSLIHNLPVWTAKPRAFAYNSLLTLETPDTAATMIFDISLWITDSIFALLHKDLTDFTLYALGSVVVSLGTRVQH